jgi:hypothetical protein
VPAYAALGSEEGNSALCFSSLLYSLNGSFSFNTRYTIANSLLAVANFAAFGKTTPEQIFLVEAVLPTRSLSTQAQEQSILPGNTLPVTNGGDVIGLTHHELIYSVSGKRNM